MLIIRASIALSVLATHAVFLASSLAKSPNPNSPEEVIVEKEVQFLEPERKERADLYLPLPTNPGELRPAVLIIHGGGWLGGKRDAKREINIGTNLAINNFVGMSIDYKLATKKRPAWPQNLYDCKTAVRWLRKNSERFQINPERIGVIGGSAGGHLAAMVAYTKPEDGLNPEKPYADYSCQVQCCVDLYGISNIPTYHDIAMLGRTYAEAPELYRAASPITYVRSDSPPTLILHGTKDATVALDQSKLLAATLKKVGVKHKLVIIPGAVHSFDLQPKQRDLRQLVIGFLERHLKENGITSEAAVQ